MTKWLHEIFKDSMLRLLFGIMQERKEYLNKQKLITETQAKIKKGWLRYVRQFQPNIEQRITNKIKLTNYFLTINIHPLLTIKAKELFLNFMR